MRRRNSTEIHSQPWLQCFDTWRDVLRQKYLDGPVRYDVFIPKGELWTGIVEYTDVKIMQTIKSLVMLLLFNNVRTYDDRDTCQKSAVCLQMNN